ncbi:hypothetical protein [Streptomyces microflavus]|uniref:hypothetical protein n=1 Tax=Streptomyces microflavus TaxID=1919 RepID=UPI002E340292|nr:hypothetical protein [Streptomyces microflavus]
MTALAAALAALTAGYALGRYKPLHRISDWAHWHRYGKRPTGPRRWAVYAVLSAEVLGWSVAHPAQGWAAWKHRNDPPPRTPAPAYDPQWAQRRTDRTRAPEEPTR